MIDYEALFPAPTVGPYPRMQRDVSGSTLAEDYAQQSAGDSAAATRPFEMVLATTTTIRVFISTIDGNTPTFPTADTGFSVGDTPACIFDPTTDTGYLYVHVIWNSSGTITTRKLAFAATVPTADSTNGYFPLGSWVASSGVISTVTNSAYGPVTTCRNWFSNPITYSVEGQS